MKIMKGHEGKRVRLCILFSNFMFFMSFMVKNSSVFKEKDLSTMKSMKGHEGKKWQGTLLN
jgi:hypothetical protein